MGHFPDFIIIGVARCGTSSLFTNLLKHPDTCGPMLPKTTLSYEKECHFFDKKINDPRYPIRWYKERFESPQNHVKYFEATPNYLSDPKTPAHIKRYMPDAKFIAMLRNPVDRAWSHYFHWHRRRAWPIKTLKQKNHPVITKGIYWQQLERWFQFFKREQLLIIRSEDFFANPKLIITQCFEFLSLKPYDINRKAITYWDPKREYLVSRRKYEKIPENNANWLRNFYAPHNARLEKLLDRKFGWR